MAVCGQLCTMTSMLMRDEPEAYSRIFDGAFELALGQSPHRPLLAHLARSGMAELLGVKFSLSEELFYEPTTFQWIGNAG